MSKVSNNALFEAIKNKLSDILASLSNVPHMTVLWERPNNTAFAAQTISVPGLSNCDEIIIYWTVLSNNPYYALNATRILKECNGIGVWLINTRYDNGLYNVNRIAFANFNDNTIRFTTGNQNGTSMADRVVPCKIVGIKFGGGVLRSIFNRKAIRCAL